MSIRSQRQLQLSHVEPLERTLLHDIREALGQEPDLILWRNSTGYTEEFDVATGRARPIRYGLAPGSADLIGLRAGSWFSLEIKRRGQRASSEQLEWAALVRRFGGFHAVVHSVTEAKAALERARRGAVE